MTSRQRIELVSRHGEGVVSCEDNKMGILGDAAGSQLFFFFIVEEPPQDMVNYITKW